MNPGAAAFLIFFLIVSAFAGLGYLIPEMNRQAGEIQGLQAENVRLQAEIVTGQQTIQAQQKALEQAHAKLQDLESSMQKERAAKEEAYIRIQSLQKAYEQTQHRVAALESDLGAIREPSSVNVASSKRYIVPTSPENILLWLPPIVVLALASGYGLHWFRFGKNQFPSGDDDLDSGLLQNARATGEPPSELIRVFVPRDRISEFVRWLRQVQ